MSNTLKSEYLSYSQDQQSFENWLLTLNEQQLDLVASFMESDIYSGIAQVYGVPSVLC